jgi:hypothetical protein
VSHFIIRGYTGNTSIITLLKKNIAKRTGKSIVEFYVSNRCTETPDIMGDEGVGGSKKTYAKNI